MPELVYSNIDLITYCKIPNKPRGLYFSKALFEGLIFEGDYIQRGLYMEGNLHLKVDYASL